MVRQAHSARGLLIANSGAGKKLDQSARLEKVREFFTRGGPPVDITLIEHKMDATPIARAAVRDGCRLVIAMGGDGTIAAVIRGIAGSKAVLGIIRSGTLNDIGKSLGIPDDPEEACQLIAAGHTRQLDLGKVKTSRGRESYFFMATAIGLHAALDPLFKSVPKGNLAGINKGIQTFLRYDSRSKVFLTLDDERKIEVETMCVTVANLPLAGFNNLVAPDASSEDGLLDIQVYPGFTKAELLAYFAKTANQGTSEDGRLQRYQARKIKVKSTLAMKVTADGVRLGKGTVRIKALHHALSVIAPEPGLGVEAAQNTGEDRKVAAPHPAQIAKDR